MIARTLWLLTAGLLLTSSCSPADRVMATRFAPFDATRFSFIAFADAVYPLDSPEAEAVRIDWLETHLDEHAFCAGGYRIAERKVVIRSKGLLADVADIYYTGECV